MCGASSMTSYRLICSSGLSSLHQFYGFSTAFTAATSQSERPLSRAFLLHIKLHLKLVSKCRFNIFAGRAPKMDYREDLLSNFESLGVSVTDEIIQKCKAPFFFLEPIG